LILLINQGNGTNFLCIKEKNSIKAQL